MKTKTIGRKTVLLICLAAMLLLSAGVLGILTLVNGVPVEVSKELTASDEKTYRVSVVYDTDCGIPEGAELDVSEVLEGDVGYVSYMTKTEEAIGETEDRLQYRAFDISLRDPETGEVYQPDRSVKISIELMDGSLRGLEQVEVVHIHGEYEEQVELLQGTVTGDAVEFETPGFSVYVVVSTTVEQVLTASDGNKYLVSVTYDNTTGIPENATLSVYEVTDDVKVYGSYITESIEKLGIMPDDVQLMRAFDITLRDPATGAEYQPTKDVQVSIRLLNEELDKEKVLDVVHFHGEADGEAEIMDTSINGESIEFTTDGFSVYVIVAHEGGEIIEPRVEFHFIDHYTTEQYQAGLDVTGVTTAGPFNFVNESGAQQTTQILKNGETLELMVVPENISIPNLQNPSLPGTEKYFYGWYLVELDADNAALDKNTGRYTGTISFQWPEYPQQVRFENAITITAADTNGSGKLNKGDTLTWSMGDIQNLSGTMDAEGTLHVYLAPLYEDFYFINYHKGPKEDTTGLSTSLMTRKLVVFGSANVASVRIGNVKCDSPDPTHQIFVGWETVKDVGGTLERDVFHQTLDMEGNEINNPNDANGYYITVSKDQSAVTQMELYPVFAEARWMYFQRGAVGNGSSYVGAAYAVTNDEGQGTYFGSDFINGTNGYTTHLSTRPGYVLEGWYAFALTDNDGNITNLSTPADVPVKYIDDDGNEHSVTINTKAVKIVNVNNSGSAPVGNIAYSGAYNLDTGTGSVKLFEVTGGNLYVYKALDSLTLQANWVQNDTTSIRVIVWKQKVTDNKDTAKTPVDLLNWLAEDSSRKAADYPYTVKDYDYEIFYTKADASSNAVPNLTGFSGSYMDADGNSHNYSGNLTARSYTGFHYSCNDAAIVGKPNPNGTTVYNVYYDRDIHRLTFQVDDNNSGYNYTVTTSNSGTQYAFINGQFVQLSYEGGVWKAPEYAYVYAQNNNGTFGKVGDKYYELTKHVGSYSYNRTGYTYTRNTSNSGTQYGIVNGAIQQVYRNYNQWRLTDNWNGTQYNGYRYSRSDSSSAAYTGTLYTLISGTAGNNESGFETTENTSGDNLFGRDGTTYFQLSVTESDITYTYVDDNGETRPYSGDRYTRSYTTTGNMVEYLGTRYTRSGSTNSWYTVYIIEALYGQRILNQFPIVGVNGITYNNGERWQPQSNNQGWNQVMVVVEAMPDEDVTFRLNTSSTPIKTMNYYVEVLPGETGTVTYNGRQFVLYGEPVNARYNGVTSEDFMDITGFTKLGWTDANGNSNAYSSTFYIYSTTQAQTINFFYARQSFNFTFDVNYPVDDSLTYSNGKSDNLTVENIYYEAPLAQYATRFGVDSESVDYTDDLKGPDHYIFGGWFEDKSCTVPFNFNSTMSAPKIVYAKWSPETFWVKIDPNGGEINRVRTSGYTTYPGEDFVQLTGEYLTFDGYAGSNAINSSGQSTYIDADYGELITEYTIPRRFVPLSDAAASQYQGTVYYYLNYQLRDTDGIAGIYTHVRSAVYLTEEEIEHFYNFYKAIINYSLNPAYVPNAAETNEGMTLLDFDTWKQLYVSSTKYRPLYPNEHWTFLGWYKDDETTPYVFSTPVTGAFTLTARWRLDGGYRIEYVPKYTMPDGAKINGTMPSWEDPEGGILTYADGAETEIYKAPTGLTKDDEEITDDSVIFRGWALVSRSGSGTDADPYVYKPMEVDGSGNITTYYEPSDPYTVNAANADSNSNIYLQAIYQYKDMSDRVPGVANLTLDANTGYINSSDSSELPDWDYPGTQAINTADHIVSGNPTQILFGDIQSSAAVHLYRYATEITEAQDGTALSDAHQFFTHPEGYFLLGFDDDPTEGDYVATYPADSVVAVTRNDSRTIYAIWEPMVYMTFENKTGVTQNDVTFGLSSTMETLEVINVADGMYDRRPLSDYSTITLKNGESITLAFPKGAEQTLTISGVNNLGVGKKLVWDSSVEIPDGQGSTTTYSTIGSSTYPVPYTHTTRAGETHTHNLVHGEVNNTKSFSFDETLIVNEKPLTVTFTKVDNDYVLLLDDNYTGGGMQEIDLATAEIRPENGVNKTLSLPTTSTRTGYTFVGWAYDSNATTPDFSASSPAGNPWTILNLDDAAGSGGFFSENIVQIDGVPTRTLYGVWEAKTDAIYIYKEVPEPGNQEQAFTFTLSITGAYKYGSNGGSSYTISESETFKLKHGEYLKISSANWNPTTGSGNATAFVESVVEVYTPVTDPNTGITSDVKDDARSATIRWERSVTPRSTNRFDGLELKVAEAPVDYYDTKVKLSAEKNVGSLSPFSSNGNDLPKTVTNNYVSWRNTDDGGTVVFVNQRQTYDVRVSKALTSNTSTQVTFNYDAFYEDTYTGLDGNTATVRKNLESFSVTSGGEKLLENIPAGVSLTVTEQTDTDDNYDTYVSVDGRAETSGKSSGAFKVGENPADPANKTHELAYRNVLKSYKVTFKLVDQDGQTTINGMFALSSSVGSLGSNLYAGAASANPGVFYTSNKFWADTYTLSQTTIPTGYLGLTGPVTLKVSGNGITSDNENVTVTGDAASGYVITVRNWKTVNVTVKAGLLDPMIAQRTFVFTGTYELDGKTYDLNRNVVPSGGTAATFNLIAYSTSDGSVSSTHIPRTFAIPVGAENLTIREDTSQVTNAPDTIATTYDTTVQYKNESRVEDNKYEYNSALIAGNDGDVITFYNSKKTVDVTVKKVVTAEDTTGTFAFTATLLNGGTPIKGYPIHDKNGTPNDPTDDDPTETDGTYAFSLAHNGNLVLTVPVGATLKIQETGVAGNATGNNLDLYETTAKATVDGSGADYSGNASWNGDTRLFTLTGAPSTSLTLTVTNGSAGVDVKFLKIDSYGAPLSGATFALYENSACTSPLLAAGAALTATSDSGGVVHFEKVPNGVWYMKETAAPAVDSQGNTLPSGGNGKTYVLLVGDDYLNPADPRGTGLWGSGALLAGIDAGSISAQTAQYKTTYGDDYDKYAVFLVESGKADTVPNIAAYGIVNTPTAERKAILKKIENSNNAPLSGAVFDILAYDRTVIATGCTSASDGVFWVGTLPYGLYYVHETTVPSGMDQGIFNDGSDVGWWYTVRVDVNGVSASGKSDTAPGSTP